MKAILCATDLSQRAQLAVDRAATLARRFGARLRLLHVVDDDNPHAIADAELTLARDALEVLAAGINCPAPIDVAIEVKSGVVFQTIVSTAQDVNADLIVMGAHRRRVLKDVVIGTTIERVMRTGRHPVLMVSSGTIVRYETVLLALDASRASTLAVSAAKSLRLLDDASLSAISAFEPIYKGMLSWSVARDSTITEYSAAWAMETQDEIRKLLRQADLDAGSVQVLAEEGPPFLVIQRAVGRLRPQLLVIGTHGRSGLGRALLGSIAERVISAVDCDILVVPSGRNA